MQREIDRLFSDLFPTRGSNNDADTAVWAPLVDLAETEDAYHLQLDLPGIAKDDLSIDFHDNTLTISGVRNEAAKQDGTNYVRVERTYGHFYRSFTLQKAVDDARIEAAYQDGVLNVTIPKSEESKPRRIAVS
jgi:HSP20 family protein